MNISPIKTSQDYDHALLRLEIILDALPNTKEGDELEILSILIENYEKEHFPIGFPDPIESIKFRMEQLGYSQNDFLR
jgi:HTH-type transcriptional regulator/antitoxin HigA